MIDTHCHLLPRLDDGPSTVEEAVLLARKLSEASVTTALCTTHYSRQYPTLWSDVLDAADSLQRKLAAESTPLKLVPTAEVSPVFAITRPLDELALRSIGSRYVVVEVGSDATATFFETVVDRFHAVSLTPIFAHPERSRAVQHSESVLDDARDFGALVQVVAPSLLGRWGTEAARAAWRLVESGTADLLGSDAHGIVRRRFHLARAAQMLVDVVGRVRVDELTLYRARELLEEVVA